MQIAHLTDIHIAKEKEDTYGVDVRSNFLKTLDHIKSFSIDLMVITGDLSFRDAASSIYKWIKKHLDEMHIPYYLIPGNHDNAKMLSKIFHFEHHEGQLFYKKIIAEKTFIFLDSSSYKLPKKQLNWLIEQDFSNEEEIILFIHHPPLLAGSYYMDTKYPLKNIKQTQEIFQKLGKHIHVFCGHYHTERSLVYKNQNIFITPSTFFGIDPDAQKLQTNSHIGWRRIWFQNFALQTKVEYLVYK